MSRGAEVIDDPVVSEFQAELTAAQQSHIHLCRGEGGDLLVERIFPAQHHLDGGTPPFDHPTAVRHMLAAQEHFNLLRDPEGPNLVVPEVEFSTILGNHGSIAIRGIREYVQATPFGDYWNWELYGSRAPLQPQAARLAGSLIKYYVGIAHKGLDMYLGDISGVHQWGVTPNDRIVLLDDDPLMCDIEPDKSEYVIGDQLRNVQAWARLVQPAETGEELMEVIEDVIQSNGFGV